MTCPRLPTSEPNDSKSESSTALGKQPALALRRNLFGLLLGAAFGPAFKAVAATNYADPKELYAALNGRPDKKLSIGGGVIDIVFADGGVGLDRTKVVDWVLKSAKAVTTYFGRFPVDQLGLLVIADESGRIGSGTTFGFAGSAIRIHVGREADGDAFLNDWVLVHEMTHLALPDLPRRNLWLQEGSATYIEPIARAQAGQLDPRIVWRWAIQGMPKGEPKPGDQGLDLTPTWGRTYWGGATFWLLADIDIYERTGGRRSLRDALRTINRTSGGNGADWTADQLMAAGDAATGVDVLAKLYAEHRATPVEVDLPALFKKLGVAQVGDTIILDEAAPLAAFRRRLTEA